MTAVKFERSFLSQEHLYALGRDSISGSQCLAIPVTIGVVDYLEYYRLEPGQYAEMLRNPSEAIRFADECRERKHDDLLIQKPGWNRGVPV